MSGSAGAPAIAPAPARPGPAQPAPARPLLPAPGERWLWAALFAAQLAVFGQKLVVPYLSSDDYVLVHEKSPWIAQYLSQGRPLQLLVQLVGHWFGGAPAQVPAVSGLLAMALLAAATGWILRTWELDRGSSAQERALAIACGVLALCVPFAAEQWSFRIAPIYYGLALAPGAAALVLARERSGRPAALVVPTLLVAAGMLSYQLALAALLCAVCGAALLQLLRDPAGPRAALRSQAAPLAVVVAGYGLAAAISRALQKLAGAAADGRGELLQVPEDLAWRAIQLLRLLKPLVVKHPALEMPAQRWLLVPLLVAAGIGIAWASLRGRRPAAALPVALLGVLGLAAALFAALFAIAPLRAFGTTPRVLVAVGLFWALAAAVAWQGPLRLRPVVLGLAGCAAFAFAITTVKLENQQLALNQYDRALASRIAGRLEPLPGFAAVETAVFVDAPLSPAQVTHYIDLNVSALAITWSGPLLFGEVIGRELRWSTEAEREAAKLRCAKESKWPAAGSALIDGRIVVVCF